MFKEYKLSELYTISSGLSKSADQFGFGEPFLSFSNVFRNYFVPSELGQLVNSTNREQANCSIKRGDVFLTRTSETLEELGMSSVALKDYKSATFNGFTKRLRPTSEEIVYPEFIGYYLRSAYFRAEITAYSTLTTRASLNNEIIERLRIKLPPVSLQKKIASILLNYDNLIENNNRRIAILEEMAEEIYKEWFVRLRFPNWKETKVVDGIPEGWEKRKIGDLCEIQMGQSPKSEFYNEKGEGLPFHQGVTNFQKRFPVDKKYCTKLKKIADPYDILLSVRAPVGRINISSRRMIIGRGLCSVKSDNKNQNYLFYLLRDTFKHGDSFGNGAVFNAVSKSDIEKIPVLKPELIVENQFQDVIKPIDEEIKILTDKNKNLQKTRDLLLPRLVSGKLSVEHLVEPK